VIEAEHDAIARMLTTCPGQPPTLDQTATPTRVKQNLIDSGAAEPSGSEHSSSATLQVVRKVPSPCTSAGPVF
jgi:hypothetical protein